MCVWSEGVGWASCGSLHSLEVSDVGVGVRDAKLEAGSEKPRISFPFVG